jgi:hypothetical protein
MTRDADILDDELDVAPATSKLFRRLRREFPEERWS